MKRILSLAVFTFALITVAAHDAAPAGFKPVVIGDSK